MIAALSVATGVALAIRRRGSAPAEAGDGGDGQLAELRRALRRAAAALRRR